ncbi:MAG: bifunctional ADP-dependent NAD(P)H-hydrate dehydratase/NAD(P)H-hydrate epimerase [Ahrensia sp.]|nr:bifunctional ADP-dependent NAD(P)H-hydrate dehydratase/NAD(P)H-hydrate epimerase [Ahrensia sp.]
MTTAWRRGDWPNALLACEQMARADKWTIGNAYASGIALMDNAGAAVARLVLDRFGDAARVSVLCGPGNNGGDGYVAAQILREAGMAVTLHPFGAPKPGTDAAIAAGRCSVLAEGPEAFHPAPDDVVIDALFGSGLTRGLPDDAGTALAKARDAGSRIVAVDLPSGVNGDSGADLGGAVAADATVTFFRKKPGHLLYPGRALCGETVVADIGVRAEVFGDDPPSVFENGPALWADALPRANTGWHKYARGHAAVFSGGRHATGAARLSAMAAQRAGAGAVTILGQPDALDIHAAQVTSIMLRPCQPDDAYDRLRGLKGCRACVLGPGFGDLSTARLIALSLLEERHATGLRLVLDADGITAFASDHAALFDAAKGSAASALVLTPHEGEFARLFPDLAEDGRLSKLDKALQASSRANAIVLYKGPDTVIAAPDGRAAINSNATPALATAGSGDVLAGVVAGLLAQDMPCFEAACAAAWLHGEAGRAAGPLAIAEDLVSGIAPALAPMLS